MIFQATVNKHSQLLKYRPIIELVLFLIPLCWALYLAISIQATSDQGIRRWQSDADWILLPEDLSQLERLPPPQLDMDGNSPLLNEFLFKIERKSERWQSIFQSDVERLAQNSRYSKKELLFATKRLERWLKWRDEFGHANHSTWTQQEVQQLNEFALALNGQGNSIGSQAIHERVKLSQTGDKANQLITIVSMLMYVICIHWLVTYVLFASLIATLKNDSVVIQAHRDFDYNLFMVPVWWFFTSTGWLLIVDQSMNFHERLRFLALDQWWSWCISSFVLLTGIFVSPLINRWCLRVNSFIWIQIQYPKSMLIRCLLALVCVVLFSVLHHLQVPSYLTGESLKIMFVLLASGWCLWKMPLASQLWHEGFAKSSVRLFAGLLSLVLIAALISALTADKGTWLVIAICCVVLLSSVMGWTTGFLLLTLGFMLVLLLGEQINVVGDRLHAWNNAFTAEHDDMSRLLWFQFEASKFEHGWGVGQTPWCAGDRLDQCSGLPLQLQSDYTMTALIGWFGQFGAWTFVIGYSFFLFHWLSIAAKRSNSEMQPHLLIQDVNVQQTFGTQVFFLTGLLLLVQSWITVSGNISWIPLTGITWPLLSYGKTSLWLTSAVMGIWAVRTKYA